MNLVEHKASLVDWLNNFFHYALWKKKNCYWAWNDFLIVLRHQRNKKLVLIVEVPQQEPPFLVQKHFDVSLLDRNLLIHSLMLLVQYFESSPMLPRNREYSVRFLSFQSFLHMIQQPPIPSSECAKVDGPLLLALLQFLAAHGVIPKKQPTPYYSLSQLRHEKQA